MKRFILVTTAALALAACSDTNPVIETRAPPSSPHYYRPVYGGGQTIFTNQIPNRTSVDTDGGREVGTRFSVGVDGLVNGFRFYKAAGESGTHTARLWTTSGTLLASATFSNETSSGWQSVFAGGTAITAGTYVVSVNTNVQMVKTAMYFDTAGAISHGDLYADLSYHGQPAGSFPTTGGSGIYFVDVNFRPFICDLDAPNSCM